MFSTALLFVGLAWPTADAAALQPAENLVRNGGFDAAEGDRAAHWSGDRRFYRRADGEGRSGGAALVCAKSTPEPYVLCGQTVAAGPGRKYLLSAWIKTENVAGEESGATVCIEWRDAAGKWLGGCYPHGVKGTSDWTQITAITRLPQDAADCRFSCYLRRGMTGKAWFDDLRLERQIDPPMESMLLRPVYRGRIDVAGPATADILVRLNRADCDVPPTELRYRTSIGGVVQPPRPCPAAEFTVRAPLGDLPVGRHSLLVELLHRDRVLHAERHALQRTAADRRPPVYIDEHRRTIVDGKPFLPLGLYFGSIREEDLRELQQSKFNCMMPYGSPTAQQLDLAHRYQIKVIYSIKDFYAGSQYCPQSIVTEADEEREVRARIARHRGHPALLAWYLNDELPQTYLPRLEAHQRFAVEEDPDHPTWVVLYQYREVARYRHTFDVIGTDPYPIGRKPASEAAAWTAETFRQVGGARAMWQVPQLHNWRNYDKTGANPNYRTPTPAEIRSMAWQCLAEGATGLVFYCWNDLRRNPDAPFAQQWPRLKEIAAEIDRLAPALLSVEAAGDVRPIDRPGWLHYLIRRHGGRDLLVVVNNGDGEGEIAFEMGSVHTIECDGRAFSLTGGVLRDRLPRLAVRVYHITR